MDNRRYARPSTRDTRRFDADVVDVDPPGTEVEVVELSPPPKPRELKAGTIWVAIILVGLIGFGAGLSFPRGAAVVPEASGLPIAGTSPAPAPTSGTAILPTPAPTIPRTPTPTRTPAPEEWLQYPIDIPGNAEPLGLWSFAGQFVLPVRIYVDNGPATFVLMESMTGRTWVNAFVPPAIQDLQGGTVFDGRLWFVAVIAGVSSSTVELISTDGRGDWASLGPVEGLSLENGSVALLTRAGERWVVSTYQYRPDSDVVVQDIRHSRDGVHWSVADVPGAAVAGVGGINAAFSIGGTFGLLGTTPDDTNPTSFVLTSSNGKDWKRVDLPVEDFGQVWSVACAEAVCVAIGAREDTGVYLPTVATSTDGVDWTLDSSTTVADIARLLAIPGGFLALDGRGTTAWTSTDGKAWRRTEVVRDNPPNYIMFLATNDVWVTAIGGPNDAGNTGSSYASWAGVLEPLAP